MRILAVIIGISLAAASFYTFAETLMSHGNFGWTDLFQDPLFLNLCLVASFAFAPLFLSRFIVVILIGMISASIILASSALLAYWTSIPTSDGQLGLGILFHLVWSSVFSILSLIVGITAWTICKMSHSKKAEQGAAANP